MATESLTFSIGADTAAFQNQMKALLKSLGGLAAAFITVQAATEAFSKALDMGGRLNDLSSRTGETAGNLAVLERAFKNAGSSADKVGPSINKMQKTIQDAAEGSKEASDALEMLGIKSSDLAGKLPIDQMQLIAEKISRIPDPTQRAAAAIGVFGKSGGELLPVLRDFSGEIDAAKAQLGSLPGLLDESAARIDGVGDSLGSIKEKSTEFAYGILSELVPALEMATGKLSELDAAGSGVTFAQGLMGAVQKPLETLALYGETLILGAKKFGNELISVGDYAGQVIGGMFGELWPMSAGIFKQVMIAASADVAASLFDEIGKALIELSRLPGLSDLKDIGNEFRMTATVAREDMVRAVEELSSAFGNAFATAVSGAEYVREDFLDAAGSADRIADKAKELIDAGKEFSDQMKVATMPLQEIIDSLNPAGKAFADMMKGAGTGGPFTSATTVGGGGGGGGGGSSSNLFNDDFFNQELFGPQVRRQERATSIKGADYHNSYKSSTDLTVGDLFDSIDPAGAAARDFLNQDEKSKAGAESTTKAKQAAANKGSENKQSSLEATVSEIRRLVALIEPKLPQQVLV